jgi:hypothetical protein
MSEGIIKAEPACSSRQDNSHGPVGGSRRSVARELGVVGVRTGQVSVGVAVVVVEVRTQGVGEARRRSTYVEYSFGCQVEAMAPITPSAQFLGREHTVYANSPSIGVRLAKRLTAPIKRKGQDDDKRCAQSL